MSTENRWSGEIRIVPPLTWDEVAGSQFLPGKYRMDNWRPRSSTDVKLRVIEVPIDGGFARQADAIIPLDLGTYDGREVLTHVAAIVAEYGEGHTFQGRIECVDDPGYGLGASRIEVHDGRARQIYARIVWPENEDPDISQLRNERTQATHISHSLVQVAQVAHHALAQILAAAEAFDASGKTAPADGAAEADQSAPTS